MICGVSCLRYSSPYFGLSLMIMMGPGYDFDSDRQRQPGSPRGRHGCAASYLGALIVSALNAFSAFARTIDYGIA